MASETEHMPAVAQGAGGEQSAFAGDTHLDSASENDGIQEKTQPLTRRQKVKRHCGKYWLWYLIGQIIFLAILLPITFEVILPAIVQDIVNYQNLPVKTGALYATTATELKVSLTTLLFTPLPALVEPLTLDMYDGNTTGFYPFGRLTFPQVKVNKYTNNSISDQTVPILNQTELVKWFNSYFTQDTVELSVTTHEDFGVKLGELHSQHHLTQTINFPGLNYLSGFSLLDLKLMLGGNDSEPNIKGTLNLPNAGVLTLGLGDLTLNMLSGNLKLGKVSVPNVVLKPGNNTCEFSGNLYLKMLLSNLGELLAQQSEALNNGYIELNTTGDTAMVNGEHITYLEEVLNTKTLTAKIPVITLISDFVNALIGGGKNSIMEVLGDVFGNTTFIDHILDNFNHTDSAHAIINSHAMEKRQDPKRALMWQMMKFGLRGKLGS